VAERSVDVLAPAKINVFLRVLGRRDDGYHDIESLILPVSLSDELSIRDTDGPWQVTAVGHGPLDVPADEPNLVSIAARALGERCGGSRGLEIGVSKRIPVAAGLGGGSADAAATLLALNELWSCRLSREELMAIGAEVGSDIPALVHGGPVVVRGRGDIIEPARVAPTWWVLRPQDFPVSSAAAYGWWDEEGSTGADARTLLEAARVGRVEELAGLLFNDLEPIVVRRHPQVEEAKRALMLAGALDAVMSGSGPTVAGLARDERHAGEIAAAVPGAIPVSAPP
jgi:4-diphosphocytidyl-2-C-methyl-D-erythritol kinase